MLVAGGEDTGKDFERVSACRGAVAAEDLAVDDRGPVGLLGAPVGGLEFVVVEESQDLRPVSGQVAKKNSAGYSRLSQSRIRSLLRS